MARGRIVEPLGLVRQQGGCAETRPCLHLPPCGLPDASAWINVTPGKDVNLTLVCPEVTKGERQRRRLDEEKVEWEIWSRDKRNWEPLVEANHPFQKKGVDLYVGRATRTHAGEQK